MNLITMNLMIYSLQFTQIFESIMHYMTKSPGGRNKSPKGQS